MLPSFDKKSGWFPKRDSQHWWDLNKTPSSTSEFERDRDRNKLPSRSRNQTRSITHQNSLPTIIEPTDAVRTNTTSVNEECSGSKTGKTDRVNFCIKRWKKVGLGRSHASTSSVHDHFEVRLSHI